MATSFGADRGSRAIRRKKTSREDAHRDVAQVIFETTERLCGQLGLEVVSVRDIAQAADVSLSAVNYYYGSRSNLLLTILKVRGAEISAERTPLLEQAARSTSPDLRQILRAVMLPLSRWRAPGSPRNAAMQFLNRALAAATPELKNFLDETALGFTSVIDLLQRALPHLSREEICWRFHFMMSIEHMNIWDADRLKILSSGVCRSEDPEETLERALDFAVAGFLAPVRADLNDVANA